MKKISFILIVAAIALIGFSFTKEKEGLLKQQPVGVAVGNIAPEISLKNPNDSVIKLSSLTRKGQLVLIDFWASWCGPCRMENPNLVATYNKFKDKQFTNGKGFTVYSVSLDKTKEPWVKAIDKDQLVWPYHVSDLAGWQSQAAAMYSVTGIPTNFLIDNKGIILATGLRGKALDDELAKYTKEGSLAK